METLPKYSGDANFVGYPYFYLVGGYRCECFECATESQEEGREVEPHVNWEDPELHCETCSSRIESAYADEKEVKND